MVQFEKNEKGVESFTINVLGDKEKYLDSIKSLLTLIRVAPEHQNLQNEFYNICSLIDCMLPDANQIINKEDVALLKDLKTKKD